MSDFHEYDDDDDKSLKLDTYLNENNFNLNSDPIFSYKSGQFYYKYPIGVNLWNDEIIIENYIDNRKFVFNSLSNENLIVNFLKHLSDDVLIKQ